MRRDDDSVLLATFGKLTEETLLAIAQASAAEADYHAEDNVPEAEAFAAIYEFISAVAQVALLRQRTGVNV